MAQSTISAHTRTPTRKQLLTRKETADVLRVSLDALEKFCARDYPDPGFPDPLPRLRAGRRWLFDLDTVFRWAEREARRPPPKR